MTPVARDLEVIEHGETSVARTLRRQRLRIALVIAVVEGILVIADVIPWWLVLSLALLGLVAYTAVGRTSGRADVRNITWIAAVSQLIVVLVPIAAVAVGILAIVVVALLAVVALVALLADRR
jgi:hypothetical protein